MEVNESFSVKVSSDFSEDVGIKAFINRSTDAKSMSEMLVDREWKKQYASAPYYYTYPSTDEFTLRAFDSDKDTTLCVYMQTSPISKECISIKVLPIPGEDISKAESSAPEVSKQEYSKDQDGSDHEEEKEDQIVPYAAAHQESSANQSPPSITSIDVAPAPKKPILLSAKQAVPDVLYTKEAKVRIAMNYVLAFVSLLLLFLVCTRRV